MYIDFTICSNENDFKELKNLFPTSKILNKGDLLKSGKKIPYNEFSIIFEQKKINYVDDLIKLFKEYIGDKYLILSEYIKNNKLNSSFCIVLKELEHPALSIEHENLLFLSMLNARIDFDFI